MDLTGWVYILTFGKDTDIYAWDGERVGISKSTGKVVIRYEVKSKEKEVMAIEEDRMNIKNLLSSNKGGLES